MFNMKTLEKHQELCNFDIEAKNISVTNNCDTEERNRVPIILNWIGWEGLKFIDPK